MAPQEYIVYVDSNNRDQLLFPNSNNYTLYLTTPIRNVSKVELLTAMLPGMNTSQFITLDILELRTPNHLTAAALQARGTSNLMVPTSNAFYGSFATIPIKVSGNDEFYNANYRISTEFPARIDKIDRLTVTWRQPNNGSVFYDPTGSDLGRNMFLLRFEAEFVPIAPPRPASLPPPVPWSGTGDRQKLMILVAVAILGLLVIVSVKKNSASPPRVLSA